MLSSTLASKAAVASLLACTVCAQEWQESLKCTNNDVIVIGAGLSGLAAARDLQDRGCEVVLLEGRHHIGGRAPTPPDNHDPKPWDFAHDMGGQYQHGSSMANSITWLADRLGFENTLSGGDSAYIGERDKVSSNLRLTIPFIT